MIQLLSASSLPVSSLLSFSLSFLPPFLSHWRVSTDQSGRQPECRGLLGSARASHRDCSLAGVYRKATLVIPPKKNAVLLALNDVLSELLASLASNVLWARAVASIR